MRNNLTCSLLLILPFLTVKTCKKPCYNSTQITQRWKNSYTRVQEYDSGDHFRYSYKMYPNGIFELNDDGTYKVVSDEVPLDGKWAIDPDCRITLDKGSSNQRTFTVLRLNADSLVISRADTVTHAVYTQYYTKN